MIAVPHAGRSAQLFRSGPYPHACNARMKIRASIRANVSVPEMFRATRIDELPLLGPSQSRRAALSPLPGSQS
jgi:hypothetical protein